MADSNGIEKTTLSSGLRVVTERMPHVRSVAVGFWVGTGSAHERDSESGASHLIEHMLFKGTPRLSALDIAETVEGMGGAMNAGTGREYTCLYARVMDEHFSRVLGILGDMVRDPALEEDDLALERRVVLEEIKMYEDSPDEVAHDLLLRALWPDHPLSRSILGTRDTVSALGRDDLSEYHGSQYVPERTVLSVAGNVEHEAVLGEVERCLGDWNSQGPERSLTSPSFRSQALVRQKDIEQVHLCLGGPGPALDDDDLYPTMVVNALLGGGTSSRLFQVVREQAGLAYSVNSFQSAMKKTGLMGVYAATSPDTAGEALSLILTEIRKMADQGVKSQELKRAREHIKGNLMLSLEGTGARMTRMGRGELSQGRVLGLDELLEKLDSVSEDDVSEVLATSFNREKTSLSAVGPVPDDLIGTYWGGD